LWRGHLDKLLARPTKVHKVKHFSALPHADVPSFIVALSDQEGVAAKALAFCILTATRTSEVINARWNEIDGETWTIPADRTKAGREHRVPLSSSARAILDDMRAVSEGETFVFPGGKRGKPLSNMAMTAVLRRMGRDDVTVHGFRSAFRDWCGERTNFPRELAEAALSHVVKDKTEAAYARGDMLTKRAQLMNAWARYCSTPTTKGEVVKLANNAKG
jgi:integrase